MMLLTMLAYAMIIVFMYVVMKKKMTPFTALVMIPLIMTIAVILTGSADFNADAKFVAFVGDGGIAKDLTAIGPMVMYGILPVLAEAGAEYGFSNMAMALASLMGQAFHLLSPLVAFIYLLLRLTGLDMGEWQKEAAKYALIIFVIFVVTIIAMRQMPLYIPQ